jgi:hypothetical protein
MLPHQQNSWRLGFYYGMKMDNIFDDDETIAEPTTMKQLTYHLPITATM